jgi:putative ABC transport system permease protein
MDSPASSPGEAASSPRPRPLPSQRFTWFEDFYGDARYFLRSLLNRGNRSFATVAILTLALGIGSATAIFSVGYGMLYDAYPYADVNEIWSPWINFPPSATANATRLPRNFVTAMEELPAVAEVMSSTRTSGSNFLLYVENPNVPNNREVYPSFQMSGNGFAFLGVKPAKGRAILPSDIAENGNPAPVVVLSAAAAQKFFPDDPDPVGKTIPFMDNRGGATPKTVIGVMPKRFGGAPAYDIGNTVWTPMPGPNLDQASATLQVRPRVKLKRGVSKAVAEAQIATLFSEMAAVNQVSPFWTRVLPAGLTSSGVVTGISINQLPMTQRQFNTSLRDFASATFDPQGVFRTNFRYLSFGVGFLLLIACMNVANLQLSRAAARSREIAVRLALGASRSRLIRQLLTESVLLSLAGALAGLLVAYGFTKLTMAVMPSNTFGGAPLPEEASIGLNGNALLFSVVVAIVCGILFGLAPALQSTRQDLNSTLKDGGRGSGAHGGQIRSILVIAEMAFSIVLLVTASLALWGYVRLATVDPGYNPDRLYTILTSIPNTPGSSMTNNEARGEEFMIRMQDLPFVEGVSRAYAVGNTSQYTLEDEPKDESKTVRTAAVDADFLKVFGTRLIRGRNLTPEEISRGEQYALVGTTGGNLLWPQGVDPLGKKITLDAFTTPATPSTTPGTPATPGTAKTFEIVGIVSNMRPSVTTEPTPFVIVPHTMRPQSTINYYVVRLKKGQKANVQQEMQALLKSFDARASLGGVQDMATAFDAQFLLPRFNFVLFCTLAVIALSLAIAGIYSVLSYHIAQRTREFGVRIALGADPQNILGLVLKAGGILLGIGLAIGVVGSYGMTKIIESQTRIFTVDLSDRAALGVTVAGVFLLCLAAFAACCIPARRAMKVDPLVALRSE